MPEDLQDSLREDGATQSSIKTGGIAYNKEEEEEEAFFSMNNELAGCFNPKPGRPFFRKWIIYQTVKTAGMWIEY